MNRVWPIISNTEAIAINQQWAGHPGMLVSSYSPGNNSSVSYLWAKDCDNGANTQVGWSYDSATKTVRGPNGNCLDNTDASELTTRPCTGASSQSFAYDTTTLEIRGQDGRCVDVYNFAGPVIEMYSCNNGCNQKWQFTSDKLMKDTCTSGSGHDPRCASAESGSPSGTGVLQVWAKPQPKNAMAIFVINGANEAPAQVVTLTFKTFNMTSSSYAARDIWNHKDLGTFSTQFVTDAINGYDSRFYLFTPA